LKANGRRGLKIVGCRLKGKTGKQAEGLRLQAEGENGETG
jgi:hypothetical protein